MFAATLALAAPNAARTAAYTDLARIQSFSGAVGWLNSPPLEPAALRGKTVLVDFWEYTCVNCLRTLPYEKTWYQRYHRYGFEIIGVHTPEFAFSGEPANVAAAAQRLGITWPVALDSQGVIWKRYHNEFWPHEFLVDSSGRVVYDHVGEGDYPDTEARIQELVRAQNPRASLPAVMGYLPQDDYAKPGAVCYPHTLEVYAGSWRGDGALENPSGYPAPGRAIDYADNALSRDDGRVYVQGLWELAPGGQAMVHARSDPSASDYIGLRYHAIEVVAVLKPRNSEAVKTFVLQDGKPLGREDAGPDIRYDGGRSYVIVDSPREYDLVKNRRFGHHDLELRPVGGLGVYTFDFESCAVRPNQ